MSPRLLPARLYFKSPGCYNKPDFDRLPLYRLPLLKNEMLVKRMREIKEVTAAVIRRNGRVLIAQRAKDDELPLMWEFPGGKLEPGETLEQCIVREMEEELGVTIRVTGVLTTTDYRFADRHIHFTVYNAELAQGEPVLKVHNDLRWVEPAQLKEYDFMPPDLLFLDKVMGEQPSGRI